MKLDELRARRLLILDDLRQGMRAAAIAAKHGVSIGLVWKVGHIYGHSNWHHDSRRTFRILADLLNTSDVLRVIAQRHGVDHSRVQQIKMQARAAGIAVRIRLAEPTT